MSLKNNTTKATDKLREDMHLKTNFGSFRYIVIKFVPLVNLADVTSYIKLHKAMTQFIFK